MASKSMKSIPWTTEKITELIDLFEAHPCLYNVKDDSYHDRDKRKKATEDIAKALEITGESNTFSCSL